MLHKYKNKCNVTFFMIYDISVKNFNVVYKNENRMLENVKNDSIYSKKHV